MFSSFKVIVLIYIHCVVWLSWYVLLCYFLLIPVVFQLSFQHKVNWEKKLILLKNNTIRENNDQDGKQINGAWKIIREGEKRKGTYK